MGSRSGRGDGGVLSFSCVLLFIVICTEYQLRSKLEASEIQSSRHIIDQFLTRERKVHWSKEEGEKRERKKKIERGRGRREGYL
jgi:hypothetical protein